MKRHTDENQRAKGKGMWIFELLGTDGNGAFLRETITSHGSLADAKKFAVNSIIKFFS